MVIIPVFQTGDGSSNLLHRSKMIYRLAQSLFEQTTEVQGNEHSLNVRVKSMLIDNKETS